MKHHYIDNKNVNTTSQVKSSQVKSIYLSIKINNSNRIVTFTCFNASSDWAIACDDKYAHLSCKSLKFLVLACSFRQKLKSQMSLYCENYLRENSDIDWKCDFLIWCVILYKLRLVKPNFGIVCWLGKYWEMVAINALANWTTCCSM